MVTIASSILDKAALILQDTSHVRWSLSELMGWLSDGQREVVMFRPEAFVKNTQLVLYPGNTKQVFGGTYGVKEIVPPKTIAAALSFTPVRLLDIIRNFGNVGREGSGTAGSPIRLISRDIMDTFSPNWHSAKADLETKHYMYDQRDPLTFYVYPKPIFQLRIEAVISCLPSTITATTQAIDVADIFSNALLDYLLFRAYSKDTEYAGNAARAAAHYAAFSNAMGVKSGADAQSSPAANSPLNPSNPG